MPSKGKNTGQEFWLKVVAAGLAAGAIMAPAANNGSHDANVATRDPAGCVVLAVR
jgi:hypothetical protein